LRLPYINPGLNYAKMVVFGFAGAIALDFVFRLYNTLVHIISVFQLSGIGLWTQSDEMYYDEYQFYQSIDFNCLAALALWE